jgi:hypothetical protein
MPSWRACPRCWSSAILSVEDGVKLYQQYVTKIPFVDDVPAAARS